MTLTKILKSPISKKFRDTIKWGIKNNKELNLNGVYIPRKTKQISLLGTIIDIYISYELSRKFRIKIDFSKKLNLLLSLKHYKDDISDYLILLVAKIKHLQELEFIDYYLLGLGASLYYSGHKLGQIIFNAFLAITKDEYDMTLKYDFDNIIIDINKKIESNFHEKADLDCDPIFGNNISMMAADGDLYYKSTLYEIKTSNKLEIQKSYVVQLIGYKLLNDLYIDDKDKKVIKKFAYWNPLWQIITTFELDISIDTINEFKKIVEGNTKYNKI